MVHRSSASRPLPGICFHAPSGRHYVRLSGRVIYLGLPGDPKVQELYDREIQAWLASGRRVVSPAVLQDSGDEDAYTVDHLVVDYLDSLVRRGRYTKNGEETSEMDSIRSALRALSEVCGRLPLAEFGKKLMRRYEENLIENGSINKKGKRTKLTRPGVNRKVRHVKQMLLWGRAGAWLPCGACRREWTSSNARSGPRERLPPKQKRKFSWRSP